MTDSVAALASAMRADAQALRAISQNVANAQTPAYRREIALAYSTFDATGATRGRQRCRTQRAEPRICGGLAPRHASEHRRTIESGR